MGGVGDGIEMMFKVIIFLLVVIFLLVSSFFFSWDYAVGFVMGSIISAIGLGWFISTREL